MSHAKGKFDGLLKRVYTALVLVPVVLGATYLGGFAFTFLLIGAAALMAHEWTGILRSTAHRRDSLWLTAFVVALLLASVWRSPAEAIQLLILLLFLGGFTAFAIGVRMSPIVGGLLYIGWPLLAAQHFRIEGGDILGVLLVFYVLVSVWAVDTFAMFSGKIIGGPKLAPRLSPNKTWAGLMGGVIGAMIAAYLSFGVIVGMAFGKADLTGLLVLGAVLAVVAQAADLFQSGLKRKYGIKDSGAIFPGHGGILDRVDGLIGVLIFLHIISVIRGGDITQALWVW